MCGCVERTDRGLLINISIRETSFMWPRLMIIFGGSHFFYSEWQSHPQAMSFPHKPPLGSTLHHASLVLLSIWMAQLGYLSRHQQRAVVVLRCHNSGWLTLRLRVWVTSMLSFLATQVWMQSWRTHHWNKIETNADIYTIPGDGRLPECPHRICTARTHPCMYRALFIKRLTLATCSISAHRSAFLACALLSMPRAVRLARNAIWDWDEGSGVCPAIGRIFSSLWNRG